MPILAVPPVIPLIHDDLHMTETQVGLLIGMPLMMFALAAVPGSLLIARAGAVLIAIAGLLVITSLAAAGRAAAFDIWTLYAATVADGLRRRHHAAGAADAGAAMAAAPHRARHRGVDQRPDGRRRGRLRR